MNRSTLCILAALLTSISTSSAATLRGTVKFEGAAPKLSTTPGAKCHDGAHDIVQETVIVSSSGQLKNAIVFIEGARASDGSSLPAATLDQKDCRYVPHVLAIQVNQPLIIKTSDATLHNVHYNPEINPPANFGLIEPGQQRQVSFKAAETFKVTCDVHSWMSAWVAVFDHPYFSVTSDSGTFEIKDLPAGSYKLICWHERFGKQEKSIEVTDKELNQDFVYKPPQ